MSHENVVLFLKKVMTDQELKARVATMQGDGGPESVKQLLQVAADAGCQFTESDLDELFLSLAANEAAGELSVEQLEAVAGGVEITGSESLQETSTSFNLQYLELQQAISHENRQFTMVSNIMKVKHDTAKSSINNIR